MRTSKILGLVVGGLVVLLALFLLAVWLLVNPNNYKAKIAAEVKRATGRELHLEGDVKLSVLPWIALELGPASLGNPPGFSTQPFVAFRHAAVRAKLLPLLQQRLEIARVEIDGLDLRLQKNAAGRGNWQGFGESSTPPPAAEPADAAGSPLAWLGAIRITNAQVSYERLSVVNLKVETVALPDDVVTVVMHLDANRGVAGETASVDAKLDLRSPRAQRYRIAALTVTGEVNRAGESRPVRWNMSAPALDYDAAAHTVAAPAFALNVAGAQLNGAVQGSQLADEARLTGSVTLAPLLLREFLPRWNLTVPQTHDPRVLSEMSGSMAFAYAGGDVTLDGLQLTLDDIHLQGTASLRLAPSPAVKFALSVDTIDVNRYLAPESQAIGTQPPASKPEAQDGSRPLDADGTLAIGALRFSRLDLTDVRLTLAAHDGVTHVFPLQAQLDGGRYSGDVTYQRRGDAASLSLDEHLTGVDMTRLLASSGKSIHLSGKGNVGLKATARGVSAAALLKTLNGHVDAYLSGGAVEGIDLAFELGRAEALIKRTAAPELQDTHRTPFDAFKTSADITDGVAHTGDLVISSPVLKVTGQGSANLVSKAIDFQLLADTLRRSNGVALQIPVKVTGTTSDPTLRPDIEALAKGQLKQKLKDVLQDKLQGLFGSRP